MADEFDPDAFLQADTGFDPDAFLGTKPPPPKDQSWLGAAKDKALEVGSDVLGFAGRTAKNVPSSALQFAKDVVHPVLHPVETAEALKNLSLGVAEKLPEGIKHAGPVGSALSGIAAAGKTTGGHEQYADAMGKFIADRYGSIDNFKKTVETDPIGAMSDLSLILTGGGSAAARAPGIAGRVGEAVSTLGRATDPINIATKTGELAGKGAAGLIGSLGTHTGGESIKTAARAGFEGGDAAKAFQENIRAAEPMEETVRAAKQAVNTLRQERGEEYLKGMKEVGADKNVLEFDKIDRAYTKAAGINMYKGQDLSPATAKIRDQLRQAIDDWRALDPTEFHTAEGLDALKKKIGDIRDDTLPHTPPRIVADRVYQGIRGTIIDQAPKYAKIMEGYEEATKTLNEIERTLSLKPDATIDTSLRKLQSVLRDNVNTSFGRRKELAQYLVDAGAPHLMERLAGQALRPGFARGIGRLGAQLAAELALLTGLGGHGAVGSGLRMARAAATLPLMSPRGVGETAYYAGRAASPLGYIPGKKNLAEGAFQAGRATRSLPKEEEKRGGRIRAPGPKLLAQGEA